MCKLLGFLGFRGVRATLSVYPGSRWAKQDSRDARGRECRRAGSRRVRQHHHALADLRRQGDAGNRQKGEMAQRYYAKGLEVEKGWRKRGRVSVYWPGKKGRGVVLWWVMEELV